METSVCNRTGLGSKCPYCSGKKAIKGENDLQTLFPELAKQADGWDPSELLPQSNKKVGWKCDLGHRWEASVDSRRKTGCPYCAGKKALLGFNTLLDHFPRYRQASRRMGSRNGQLWESEKTAVEVRPGAHLGSTALHKAKEWVPSLRWENDPPGVQRSAVSVP